MVTHYVEDVIEMKTKCGLTTFDDILDDVSLDLGECTCVQCLSLTICDLSKRIQKLDEKDITKTRTVVAPHLSQSRHGTNEVHYDPSVASTPVYMSKSPYTNKKRK
jgi:hypothetical protein